MKDLQLVSLAGAFARARQAGRLVVVGYLPAGFPDPSQFVELVQVAAAAGLDVLELGLPAEDPHLDGPVIRRALRRQQALGIGFDEAIRLGARARQAAGVPVVAMGYAAQLQSGMDPAEALRRVGAGGLDGVLFPDLGPDALAALVAPAGAVGAGVVGFVRPDDPPEAVAGVLEVCSRVEGAFVYVQSATPHTGGRVDLEATVAAVRRVLAARHVLEERCGRPVPVAVGFGIQEPDHVVALRGLGVDGVIVGTALVEAAAEGAERVRERVSALADAARG